MIFANPTANNLNGVFISNPGSNTNAGWAVGDAGTVLKLSITGGVPTWNIVGVPGITAGDPTQNLYGVYFKDSNHGWIVGDKATIVSTSDGGTSWSGGPNQVIGAPDPLTVLRSVFIDTYGVGSGNGDGWAVGYDGSGVTPVFAHWDGASWTNIAISPALGAQGLRPYSVYLRSPTDGFAVGSGISGTTSLSAIYHLDPPNPPTAVTTSTTTQVITTSTSSSTVSTSATSSAASTTATTSSQTSTATSSVTTEVTTSTSVETSVETQSATATTTSTVTTSSETTPLQLPSIPGFPWESIIAGIIAGLAALAITRRGRRTAAATPD